MPRSATCIYLFLLSLTLTAALAGCGQLRSDDAERASEPGLPVWNAESVASDLSTLRQIAQPIVPGTRSHRRVHLYLADRMRDVGLQPAQPGYLQPWGLAPDTSRNLLGLLAGYDPALRDTAVVLLAPFGSHEGGGVEAAAALEVARVLGYTSRFYRYPTRTVVVAFAEGEGGVAAYLRNPAWPLPATEAVVRLGGEASRPRRLPGRVAWYALEADASLPPDSAAVALASRAHALLLPWLAAPAALPLLPGP